MDGSAVRALAARVDAVAHAVGGEADLLRAMARTGWSGPAATACEQAVAGRAVRAVRLGEDLHAAATLLRTQAGAVDRALADMAATAAGTGAGLIAGLVAGAGSGSGPAWAALTGEVLTNPALTSARGPR